MSKQIAPKWIASRQRRPFEWSSMICAQVRDPQVIHKRDIRLYHCCWHCNSGGVDEYSFPCTSYLDFDLYASDAGLYKSVAHKLLIFDCDVGSNNWHNSEAIVAGPRGIDKTSRSTSRGSIGGNGSFLRGLIDDLKDINGTSTSAASIVARMTRDIFNPTPRTGIGKIARPTHHFDDPGVATITLQPQISDLSSQQHTSPSSPRQPEPRYDSHFQALISVQFAKDTHIDEYTLRQTARIQSGLYGPNLQIQVAGFIAKSTGLFAQFTVPYELLLGLNQDCGAYRFIEDVESENTLITNWHWAQHRGGIVGGKTANKHNENKQA